MSIPYMPLYITDYEADTHHLSLEEHGAYLRLLCLLWKSSDATIPDDPDWIMRRLHIDRATYDRAVATVIREFLVPIQGRLSQARLSREKERVETTSKKRSVSGRNGNAKRWGIENKGKDVSPGDCKSIARGSHPEPYPEPDKKTRALPRGFDDFWKEYPSRVGKKAAVSSYAKALAAGVTPEQILAGVKRYRQTDRVKGGFIANPATWLNQGRWEDETTSPAPVDFLAIAGRRSGRHD